MGLWRRAQFPFAAYFATQAIDAVHMMAIPEAENLPIPVIRDGRSSILNPNILQLMVSSAKQFAVRHVGLTVVDQIIDECVRNSKLYTLLEDGIDAAKESTQELVVRAVGSLRNAMRNILSQQVQGVEITNESTVLFQGPENDTSFISLINESNQSQLEMVPCVRMTPEGHRALRENVLHLTDNLPLNLGEEGGPPVFRSPNIPLANERTGPVAEPRSPTGLVAPRSFLPHRAGKPGDDGGN